jgi:Flp pilus assembly protein TadG
MIRKRIAEAYKRSQAGVALVEFALVAPLLMTMMLGLVEIGRYAYYSILVADAARAGVEYAAQNNTTAVDTSGISAAVQADTTNNIANVIANSNATCQCWNGSGYTSNCLPGPSCSSGRPVEIVTVTTSGTAKTLFNYPYLPSSLNVSATATMRVADL